MPKVAGDDRLRLLERAKSHWIGFMTTLENYGLLSDEHRTYYKRIMEGATVPSGSAKRREDVIARHKRKQKLEEDIQTLRDRKARGVEADEEVERELSLANIASFTELALENLEMVDQEMILLRGREKAMSRSTGASQAAPPLEAFQRPALNGPLLSAEGKVRKRQSLSCGLIVINEPSNSQPLKTFTLVNDRQAMQKKVFGPGHSLPTMSIDEYLERERERGNIISGGGQGR